MENVFIVGDSLYFDIVHEDQRERPADLQAEHRGPGREREIAPFSAGPRDRSRQATGAAQGDRSRSSGRLLPRGRGNSSRHRRLGISTPLPSSRRPADADPAGEPGSIAVDAVRRAARCAAATRVEKAPRQDRNKNWREHFALYALLNGLSCCSVRDRRLARVDTAWRADHRPAVLAVIALAVHRVRTKTMIGCRMVQRLTDRRLSVSSETSWLTERPRYLSTTGWPAVRGTTTPRSMANAPT